MKKLFAALLFLLLIAGCTVKPAQAPSPSPEEEKYQETEQEPGPTQVSPVYTDWSKLTPYEPLSKVYTYHAGYRTDGVFEAREDYGALLPYIGKYSSMERYVIDKLPFYGIVTDKGELVSDPTYARVEFRDDFLILYRGDPEGVTGGDSFAGGTFSRTLAAADGRWARELSESYLVTAYGGLLMTADIDGSLDLWNRDGEIIMHFDGSIFAEKFGDDFLWGEEGGPFVDWNDDKVGYVLSYLAKDEYLDRPIRMYLDFGSGAVTDAPPEGYPEEIDYSVRYENVPEAPEVDGCNYLDAMTDPVTGETYFYGYVRKGEGERGVHCLFDRSGNLLLEGVDLDHFETLLILRAGLCSSIENGCFCFRSVTDNELVFRYVLKTNSD